MIVCISVSVILLFADLVCVHCSRNNLNTGKQQNGNATLPLSSEYACALVDNGILCNEKGVFLAISHYLTYSEDANTIMLAQCPYVFTFSIKIPDNLSALNNFMCGPLRRKDLLCKDCIDGFGVSLTSLGYQCFNCTSAWYGIPLYIS